MVSCVLSREPLDQFLYGLTSDLLGLVCTPQDSIMNMMPNLPIPAGAIAIPIVSAVLAVIMSAIYEVRKHGKATMLFGKVVAPGPYEDTTLLITDIQVRGFDNRLTSLTLMLASP